MDYPLEHHIVYTNGQQLHVVQCGPVAGPLVILLHGFPEFWYSWRRQLPALASAGNRVWAPDQRGYNLSDKPAGSRAYRLPTLAADIIGLLDAAGRPQAAVVGHDWGGLVAWYLATYHADRLRRVMILNVPHPAVLPRAFWRVPGQLLRSWYIFFFQLPWLPEKLFRRRSWHFGVQSLLRTSRPGTFSVADLERYKQAWAQPQALTSMLNWYRALRYGAGMPRQRPVRVNVPVQLIWGRQDVFLAARLAELSIALCAQGQLHYFPQATHWVQLEEAEAVNSLLTGFLA
ncbi:alpha/beta hydrolase [Hymenobacter sp. BRD67]|nr:alpha/beta hydrolase [Hymenobacter sp. BRD67]